MRWVSQGLNPSYGLSGQQVGLMANVDLSGLAITLK
jgi:hypothetical protein